MFFFSSWIFMKSRSLKPIDINRIKFYHLMTFSEYDKCDSWNNYHPVDAVSKKRELSKFCWSKMIVSRRKVVRFKPVQGRKTGLQHRGTFKYHEIEIQIQYHFDSYQNSRFRFCIVHFARQHCNLFVNFNLLQIIFFLFRGGSRSLNPPKTFIFK